MQSFTILVATFVLLVGFTSGMEFDYCCELFCFFTLFLIFLLLFFLPTAQTSAPSTNPAHLLQLLEKRGEALEALVKKTIADNKASNNGHLLKSLEEQQKKVESLVAQLKKSASDISTEKQIHHVHSLEEQLFFLENRVAEEVDALEHAKSTPTKGETAAQLVARAENVVKKARETVVKHPSAPEIGEINSEIIVVEALIKAIQAKPSATDLKTEEQELNRQEKTLQQLTEKAASRHN